MGEVLTIKKLGPIKEAIIKPRPLTVIIGPQASGKSLITQTLFFFRSLYSNLARYTGPETFDERDWQKQLISFILSQIRGVHFSVFVDSVAYLRFKQGRTSKEWRIALRKNERLVAIRKDLYSDITKWSRLWMEDKDKWGEARGMDDIYLPTERSLFSLLFQRDPAAFAAKKIVIPLASMVESFVSGVNFLLKDGSNIDFPVEGVDDDFIDGFSYINRCAERAIGGNITSDKKGSKRLFWRIKESGLTRKIVPLEACSSGQMSAWPFFSLASLVGTKNANSRFYIEEPETHLHPAAQIEIMNAIAYLVNMGRSVTITTHSPFLLYVINNMIMRYQAYGKKIYRGKVTLNPDDVEAYRVINGLACPIMDRKDTNLVPEAELDSVANQLGAEFDKLMDLVD